MAIMQLTKSGNGVIINSGMGRSWITSKKWIQMLLDGRASGNMIMLNELGVARDNGIGSLESRDLDSKPKSGLEDF